MADQYDILRQPLYKTQVYFGNFDPDREGGYDVKNQASLFGCVWESLINNNTTAPATWDGGDIITPNTQDWKQVSGDYEAWLMNKDKPATTGATGDYPYNGMGRVVLRKNMVNVAAVGDPEEMVNVLTQDMFYKGEVGSRVPNTDTVFVIQYDFDLGDPEHENSIAIPSGSILKFEGGSLRNGTLSINSDLVIDAPLYNQVFYNIELSNGCPKVLHTSWWGISSGNDSTNAFEHLLNCTDNAARRLGERSVLVVDNNIELSRPISANIGFADIKGVNNGGTYKNGGSFTYIYSTTAPSNTTQSLITLKVQETNFYNIGFSWDVEYAEADGNNSIISVSPYFEEQGYDDTDATFSGCAFYSKMFCSHIHSKGRGLIVDSCVFSTSFGNLDANVSAANGGGIICCTTMQYNVETDIGTANEDQVRSIIIRNNRFHNGRYQNALRLKRDFDGTTATFKGVVFTGNYLDRGTKAVLSDANVNGIMISGNTFLFVDGTVCIFARKGSAKQILFTNNIISNTGHDMTNESYWKTVCLVYVEVMQSSIHNFKNIIVSNNTLSRVKIDGGLVNLSVLTGIEEKVNCINIIGNTITDQKMGTDYKCLLMLNGNASSKLSVNNINIIGNLIEDTDDQNDSPRAIYIANDTTGNIYKHIRIKHNTLLDSVKVRQITTITIDNPYLTDTTHWIDVDVD